MSAGPGETGKIDLHYGEPNVINFNKPVRWVIETSAGTLIKCVSTPNDPFEITPFGDIKNITVTIEDDSVASVHLLEKL
ncbi:MAG: hypothetical protein KBH34_00775 [Acetomicrobium sp.]|jgi:hypothetical protein|nr:hypothetical protein [Acetomicrobium sp.]